MLLKNLQYSHKNTRIGISSATSLKRDSNKGVFCDYCEISKNTYFEIYLRTTASSYKGWFTSTAQTQAQTQTQEKCVLMSSTQTQKICFYSTQDIINFWYSCVCVCVCVRCEPKVSFRKKLSGILLSKTTFFKQHKTKFLWKET